MLCFDPKLTYGKLTAHDYDRMIGSVADTDKAVAQLLSWAGSGPALELGVGTGRVAARLASMGIPVTGVDSSPDMLAQLAQWNEPRLEAVQEDMCRVRLGRQFKLVYCVFNTLFWLLEQREQVACFQSAAEHLGQEGRFVLETSVPDLGSLIQDRLVGVDGLSADHARIKVTEHDPTAQILDVLTLWCENGQSIRILPARLRYASPAELDLMGALANLELETRWGGWRGEPYTGRGNVVSVYRHRAAERTPPPTD